MIWRDLLLILSWIAIVLVLPSEAAPTVAGLIALHFTGEPKLRRELTALGLLAG